MTAHEQPKRTTEGRFTVGLIAEVVDVLERHGYQQPADDSSRATGGTVAAIFNLVETFEGKR